MAKESFDFRGTRYARGTVAARMAGGLVRNAVSKGTAVLAALVAVGQNLRAFGTDPAEGSTFWDRTVKNREFWVSTGVDFGVSMAVGVAAAAIVGGLLVAVTAPLALPTAVILTTVLAIGIGSAAEASGIPEQAKKGINGLFPPP